MCCHCLGYVWGLDSFQASHGSTQSLLPHYVRINSLFSGAGSHVLQLSNLRSGPEAETCPARLFRSGSMERGFGLMPRMSGNGLEHQNRCSGADRGWWDVQSLYTRVSESSVQGQRRSRRASCHLVFDYLPPWGQCCADATRPAH